MSDQAENGGPAPTPPRSVAELIAMALAMEREAAARYDELADAMARHGNPELADLFDGLAAEERKHEAHIRLWLIPGMAELPPIDFAWRSPESFDLDSSDIAGGIFLMTPHRALRLAVHNEERAFAFYSAIAATVEDPAIRTKAESLAKEELDHVVRLRLERRRAWRAQSQSAAQGAARRGPRAVQSLPALLSRARAIEHEAVLRCEFHAEAMDEWGDGATAELFRNLAAKERTLVNTLDQQTDGAASSDEPIVEALAHVDSLAPGEALRHALADAEEAFDFYAATAEQSPDQAMMEKAQQLAEHALKRLEHIRARLNEVAPADSDIGGL